MRGLLLQNSIPVIRLDDFTQYLAADNNGRVQYVTQSLPPPADFYSLPVLKTDSLSFK